MNLNTQTLDSHWQEIAGKLHEKWGVLREDELRSVRGDMDQLISTIQRRTGETKDAIQAFLEEIAEDYSGKAAQAKEMFRQYSTRAAESMQAARDQATESMRSGVHQTRQMVRQHPMESILTCFGVGVVTGVVVGMLLRPR
jgi:ElaB/YqjD/DUF883 family membrane-anchored ribosome-binding protein